MIKKALKYTLLVICILAAFLFCYDKIEEKNEKNRFINSISALEEYDEERLEDYFNYYKIHPSFEMGRIVAEVNEIDEEIIYYEGFIYLIEQPNRLECIKYFFENKKTTVNDIIVLNKKQLLDMEYDDVLAEFLHLNIDGTTIRNCVDYSKKNVEAETDDVIVIYEKQLLDLDYDNVLAQYLHLDTDSTTIRKCVEYSKKYNKVEANDVVRIIDWGLEDIEPSEQFLGLINADFFMPTRLERYLKLYQKNNDYTPRQVVEIVNCDADQQFYTNIGPTDLSKGILMINNKFNYLESDFVPKNLVVVDKKYSTYGARMEKSAYDAFVEMCEAARKELLRIMIIADNGYRSYYSQVAIYNYKKNTYGQEVAEIRGARPGHSEHQTGLAVDIAVYPMEGNTTYSKTDMYKWTIENCWDYGFIYRYQAGKEHLTGYYMEDWHYRYVGKEAALFIKEHDITFDEYYTYFIKGY